ncbi:MAG: cupin domain-containing protein [Chloroflexaceae bacterium]
MNATTFLDLAAQVAIPDDGTISRTVYQDAQVKAVLFGFAAGQELSEHTAAMAAVLHFVQGEARVTLGAKVVEAQANTWVHMPPHLPHSIVAKTPVVMLLLLLKPAEG